MTKRGQAVPKLSHFLNLPLPTYQRLQWLSRVKGIKVSHSAAEAFLVWAQDMEREAWDGASSGISKAAGAPFPPRPQGADNRRGGARKAAGGLVVQTTVILPSALEARLISGCYWRRLNYNAEAVRYLDHYLDTQGAPTDVAHELEAMDSEAARPHGQLATEEQARAWLDGDEL